MKRLRDLVKANTWMEWVEVGIVAVVALVLVGGPIATRLVLGPDTARAQVTSGGDFGLQAGLTGQAISTLKATPGVLKHVALAFEGAGGTTACYVQFFDAASPSLGSTAPKLTLNSHDSTALTGEVREYNLGERGVIFSNSIKAAHTTTPTGSTACSSTLLTYVNMVYR